MSSGNSSRQAQGNPLAAIPPVNQLLDGLADLGLPHALCADLVRRELDTVRTAVPVPERAAIVARAAKQGQSLHNIDPKLSGQRCAACGYTDKQNRKNQPAFVCQACGHTDHDDANTARNMAVAARTAWEDERGACPVPPERRGGPSSPLTAASAPVTERPGGGSRSRSLAVPLSDPRKPPDPSDPADLDSPIRRGPTRPP